MDGRAEKSHSAIDGQAASGSMMVDDHLSPPGRIALAELGLNPNNLKKLALKILYLRGCDTARELSDISRLHIAVAKELLEEAKLQGLVEILGSADHEDYQDFRYSLTSKGREWAIDALAQNQYVGPAPVSLSEYYDQIERQSVVNVAIEGSGADEQIAAVDEHAG